MSRTLVLGSTGQLGSEFVRQLRANGSAVVEASRGDVEHPFDLARPRTVADLIARSKPDIVLHAAAAGSVAWSEANPDAARIMTEVAAAVAARASAEVGARLVFFSTDYVFDGLDAPSAEEVLPAPLNAYGHQKLEAERQVLGASSSHLVLRTCQLFGRDTRRRNFVYQVVDVLRADRRVAAAVDLFGTPTWTVDLARVTLALVTAGRTGIWHAAGEEYLSRYEVARRAAKAFGLDEAMITPSVAASLGDGVPRPTRAGLRNGRLHEEGGMEMTPLDTALEQVAAAEMTA